MIHGASGQRLRVTLISDQSIGRARKNEKLLCPAPPPRILSGAEKTSDNLGYSSAAQGTPATTGPTRSMMRSGVGFIVRSTVHRAKVGRVFFPHRPGRVEVESLIHRFWARPFSCRFAFLPLGMKSASRSTGFSQLNGPGHRYLCLRFKRRLAVSPARLEARMDSLLLSCRALSSPTTCRFIPALSVWPVIREYPM